MSVLWWREDWTEGLTELDCAVAALRLGELVLPAWDAAFPSRPEPGRVLAAVGTWLGRRSDASLRRVEVATNAAMRAVEQERAAIRHVSSVSSEAPSALPAATNAGWIAALAGTVLTIPWGPYAASSLFSATLCAVELLEVGDPHGFKVAGVLVAALGARDLSEAADLLMGGWGLIDSCRVSGLALSDGEKAVLRTLLDDGGLTFEEAVFAARHV